MKKNIILLIVLAAVLAAFVGCDVIEGIIGITDGEECLHWFDIPTCTSPAICMDCGETFGEPLGHNYVEAKCDSPKTCTRCGVTEGEALGHEYTEMTCTSPEFCIRCGAVGNPAPGHDYTEATCDKPKTCTVCGSTSGEALGHNYNKFYSTTEEKHWRECSECGERTEEGKHVGGEITGNERAKCEICSAYYGEEPDISIDWTIEALTPANGSTFCLANARIKSWYETFDFRTTDTDAHWLEADIFVPDVPLLTWTVGENASYYKVYVSTDEKLEHYQCYLTSKPELTVEHLYTGTTYYWFVDAVYGNYTVRSEVFTFTAQQTPRTVDIEGVSNSRDIGGYITLDGLRIKQGLVYRSAKLDNITEMGRYTLLNVLGVKTDLDLRGDRNDYYKNATHPVTELNHIVVACPWYSTGSNHIWMDDYNKAEFAKAIKVFADPDNYPIIFHCSLGRDRTGTLAMVLEGLLGVDENTLMMEYELSVFSYWGTNGGTKYNNGLRNNIHDTYLYIDNNYEGDSFSEKVEDFLLEIGVTAEEIASIKSIMLEEVV